MEKIRVINTKSLKIQTIPVTSISISEYGGKPQHVALDEKNNIYVAEYLDNCGFVYSKRTSRFNFPPKKG
jgi:hypothetical protein